MEEQEREAREDGEPAYVPERDGDQSLREDAITHETGDDPDGPPTVANEGAVHEVGEHSESNPDS